MLCSHRGGKEKGLNKEKQFKSAVKTNVNVWSKHQLKKKACSIFMIMIFTLVCLPGCGHARVNVSATGSH